MKVVMTGGHHTSALPILKKLQHENIELHWFGAVTSLKNDTNPGLEYQEITQLGIPFYELKAGKFYRTYDLKRLAKIPYGFVQAYRLLRQLKPDLIVSFGGYLAVPTVVAAYVQGIPSITHEQTVVSGYANKVIAHFASKILITWPSSQQFFPPNKTVLTGIPVRPEIFEATSSAFDVNPALPTIYVTGGKTGSHKVNLAVLEALPELLQKVNCIHQCGDYSQTNDFDALTQKYAELKAQVVGKLHVRKFVFSTEIGEAFAKADLVVARSGAHNIYDFAALTKPCLLIPIPWVSHNEQYQNAQVLKNVGLGEILLEADLSAQTLLSSIEQMLEHLEQYHQAKIDFVKPDAAELIVNEILNYRT